MIYSFNGLNIAIPDEQLNTLMKNLDLTQEEAIQLWLEDNDYQKNEEQEKLNKAAKAVKVGSILGAGNDKPRQGTGTRQRKEDPIKHNLIEGLVKFLEENNAKNIKIKTKDKLIEFDIGEENFKLDLIKTRAKKD